MFANDYNNLNDLYDQKIIKENVGLGPLADNETVSPTPARVKKIQMPPKRPCSNNEEQEQHGKSEDCEGYDPASYDSNGQMAKQLLFRCAKISAMLHDKLAGKDNVEAWVLSKITNAHDHLETVFGYEDYEAAKNPMHGACDDVGGDVSGSLEENNEEDLFTAIAQGGDHLLSNLKSVLRRESKENIEKILLETILILEEKNKK